MIDYMDYEYIQRGKASVLVDGQFGSTGKGLLAAYLAEQPQNKVDIAVTNASANAGHWTKYEDKKKDFCCFHMPTFGVVQTDCEIYLDAGAIIDPPKLFEELDVLGIDFNRVTIHPNAAIIGPLDKVQEQGADSGATGIASTQKGVGSALAGKISRVPGHVAKDCPELARFIGTINLNKRLRGGDRVSIEVPQGYSLSIHSQFYPHTTSRQCTVAQALADAQLSPRFLGKVAMSMRTYPIRVGHIYDEHGDIIGHSGPVYHDQIETNFADLGVPEEMTTVTGRVRRVFTWSWDQFSESVYENQPDLLFLNFVNYMKNDDLANIVNHIGPWYRRAMGKGNEPVMLYGHGPKVEDVTLSVFRKDSKRE